MMQFLTKFFSSLMGSQTWPAWWLYHFNLHHLWEVHFTLSRLYG